MSVRKSYALGFLVICFLLLAAVYVQVYEGVIPCPLCVLQRYLFLGLATLFMIGAFWQWRRLGNTMISAGSIFVATLGIALAGRQTWLQHFPPGENGECSLSLEYLLQTFPPQEAFLKIWQGGTDCAQSVWSLFYLSLAEWSLIAFVGFLFFGMMQLVKGLRK